MSFGIVNVCTPTLKIAYGVQKVNKVHIYDEKPSQTFNVYNGENYDCVADLMINMNRPRTIVTGCKDAKDTRMSINRIPLKRPWCISFLIVE